VERRTFFKHDNKFGAF
jgi:hypothetical protein